MNVVKLAIERPVAVLAIVMMVVIMGLVALTAVPIQLTPDVRKPFFEVVTSWSGAAPAEIENEIINRQEEALLGLEGLDEMSSDSERGRAQLKLEFTNDTNIDRAMMLVSNRFNQIRGMPSDADEPQIRTRDSEDNPIAFFTVGKLPGNNRDVFTYGDIVEDIVKDRLERIQGVALVNVWGGNDKELKVIIDPQRMARYGLTITEITDTLSRSNISMSAGDLDEGKRLYVVRTEGELITADRVNSVVLRSRQDPDTGRIYRVTVGDVADVEFGYARNRIQIWSNGERAIIVNVIRATGANVLTVMKEVKDVVKRLNEGPLKNAGLVLNQVYDETIYIESAIGLVNQNIYIGGTLAALILLLFLRSVRATLVVSLAIPVSVIGSFVAMAALGRSINVMSLAGFAFAIGMVVDAAIVVLENIFRLRQEGKSVFEAALRGADDVWGAVMVSAVTTVVVFVPILVMNNELGQLFRDIAVAISVSIILSLIVAVTVIPSLAKQLLGGNHDYGKSSIKIPLLDPFGRWFIRATVAFTKWVTASKVLCLVVVAVVCGGAGFVTWNFLPKLEYLPEGNRNLLIGRAQPPPGYNLGMSERVAKEMAEDVRYLFASETGPESKPGEPPKMERFWTIILPSFTLVAASAVDPMRAKELVPVVAAAANKEPGSFAIINQASLFGRGIGGSRRIDLDISGPNLEENLAVANRAMQILQQVFPRRNGNQFRPQPGLNLGAPEVRVIPNFLRLSDNGITARELALTVDAHNDGVKAAEVAVGGDRIDLVVKGPENRITQTQGIANIPIATRSGQILRISDVAKVEVTEGPTEIRHLERERNVSIQIRPAQDIPLETALNMVEDKVIAPLRAEGIPPEIKLGISGNANKLTEAWQSMVFNLLLALVIVYLVMAVLFESFVYPFIIIFSVPLATAGGVVGLIILNLFYFNPLDMLTMLGFVILIGTVVNNAILLVHQTLFLIRQEGYEVHPAIIESTRNRIRPIFMSTLTSVVGMLPLVISPGAGSELYRGLGSVVVGGLALSAVLTILIIPPLLRLVAGLVERKTAGAAQPAAAE